MPTFCFIELLFASFSQVLPSKKLTMSKMKKKAAGPESLSEVVSAESTCAQRPKTSFDIPLLITFNSRSANCESTVLTQMLLSDFISAQSSGSTSSRSTSCRIRNGSPTTQTPLCPVCIYPTSTRAPAMYWSTICIPALIKRSTTWRPLRSRR